MKAIVLHEYGGPDKLKYEDFDDPVVGEGEVLVRTAAASVNPVDIKMRTGEAKLRFPVDFPGILGRDVSGVVRAVGPKVEGFDAGDEVMAMTNHTYAELVVVKASDLVKVPKGLDIIRAAALPLVTLTGEQLIQLGAKVERGQTILVAGAIGGVGRTALMTAKEAGAIVIAGVRKKQLEQAKELKADQVIALDDEDSMAELGFVDAVADAVGGRTAEMLAGKVKQGGIFASVLGPPSNAKLHPTVQVNSITAHPDANALRRLAEAVVEGRLNVPVDRMIALEDVGEGHKAAGRGGIGKVLLLA